MNSTANPATDPKETPPFESDPEAPWIDSPEETPPFEKEPETPPFEQEPELPPSEPIAPEIEPLPFPGEKPGIPDIQN